ncbi:MAG: hypothetical protein P9M14_14830 [Candidatus Alcyoniella australis]|nr:hypothetical protein [Candidatus Alcyoniella australis]
MKPDDTSASAARTCLALFSGGLDSVVAVKLMLDQGINVIALHFVTPFFSGRYRADRAEPTIEKLCGTLGVELRVVAFGLEYLEILRNPRHGMGKNFNPCLDCRIAFLRRAAELMGPLGADWLITGEVLGQRPMSQRRDAMHIVERESGLRGYLLRPLCAALLEPTVPEQRGWVDRSRLLSITGRGRKQQFELTGQWGIEGFANPAGGCLLTDPNHARKTRYLLEHQQRITLDDLELLKRGRHFMLGAGVHLVVARNDRENQMIEALEQAADWELDPQNFPGPLAVIRGEPSAEQLELAAQIVLRYGNAGRSTGPPRVLACNVGGERRELDPGALPEDLDDLLEPLRL